MKKLLKLLIIIIFVYLSFFKVYATPPQPTSFVEETTIAGIIPINDENIIVNNININLDLTKKYILNIDEKIEQSAYLKLNYELTNSGNNSVKFVLPFLNKLAYFPEEIVIKVNGNKINPTLDIYPDYNFYDYDYSYTKMLQTDFLSVHTDTIKDYEFINDIDGYLYTIQGPKTHGEDFYADIKLNYINVPEETIFFNSNGLNRIGNNATSGWSHQKSEAELYFFASSDLQITSEAIEFEKYNNIFIGHGVVLENPKITKAPIKLANYLENYVFDTFKSDQFASTKKNFFYYLVDNNWDDRDLYASNILKEINENYYEMLVEFEVPIEESVTNLEIELPIPIHTYTGEMALTFVSNPAKKLKEIKKAEANLTIKAKLISSSSIYSSTDNTYQWIFDSNETLNIVLENSHYRKDGGNMIGLIALLMMIASFFTLIFKIVVTYIVPIFIGIFILAIIIKIYKFKKSK